HGEHVDLPVADGEVLVAVPHASGAELPMNAVVAEKMSERARIGEVVDRDELEVLYVPLVQRANDAAPDPSKPIDCELRGHPRLLRTRSPRGGRRCCGGDPYPPPVGRSSDGLAPTGKAASTMRHHPKKRRSTRARGCRL